MVLLSGLHLNTLNPIKNKYRYRHKDNLMSTTKLIISQNTKFI